MLLAICITLSLHTYQKLCFNFQHYKFLRMGLKHKEVAHSSDFLFKHSKEKRPSPRVMFLSFFIKCLGQTLILLEFSYCMLMPFHYFFSATGTSPFPTNIALFNYFRKTSHLNEMVWHFQGNHSHFASPCVMLHNDFCTSLYY